MTGARDRLVVDAFREQVARLPAQGYGTIEFAMSPARRERLIRSGRRAMQAYLDAPHPADTPMPPDAAGDVQSLADRAALRLLRP